jgi:hypothetical protein
MNPSPEEATSTGYMTMEQGQTKHASEVNVETPSIVHKNASQDAVEKVRKMLRVDISELEMHFHLALLIPQVIVVPIVLNKFWNTEKNCHRYEVWALVQVVVAACMLGLYWLMVRSSYLYHHHIKLYIIHNTNYLYLFLCIIAMSLEGQH